MNLAVAYYLAKDAVPLCTVDKPGFRHFVLKLNPRYDLPSRKHFSSMEIPGDTVVIPVLRQADC